ncbi:MAG: Phage major tail tube protein [Novosphingobium sp.]|nr:Phage major tail tube protein [Novosphingobium sp.]
MGLPAKLKNFNMFSDGNSWLGLVAELSLPKLSMAMEKWRGGGMLAEVDIAMGLEALEMEIKLGGLVVQVLRQFGASGLAAVLLRFVGAYQDDLTGGVTAAELVVRGRHSEIDPGNAKAGDNTEWTVKSSLVYLKWTVAGRVEIEVDVINNIFIVDGVDRMAEIRLALGQ